ncbi:hypothetical protein BJD55_gp078 [Gordonia phage Yvonnetastic]|uniref:Uncharacterized protein n=1 Tax=Gordonia phage Yvonnetastic TaxID=1821566 RepID=A0A142K9A5_9CAUD|nr:hypothetical protein BJD55_gp078 [Gordonia phage Yvonnetastic]AMS02688.1 hypothetical protein SEA_YVONNETASTIC_144 [Gordonia phage Yvonnetastic]WKW86121.1 hypothetical protein SEA_JONJAMES_147 [Gordonia Phage JonJames]
MKKSKTIDTWECDRCESREEFDPEQHTGPKDWAEFKWPFPYETRLLCGRCCNDLKAWVAMGPFAPPVMLPDDGWVDIGRIAPDQFKVHDHDLDPSCKEIVLKDGRRIGECLLPPGSYIAFRPFTATFSNRPYPDGQ